MAFLVDFQSYQRVGHCSRRRLDDPGEALEPRGEPTGRAGPSPEGRGSGPAEDAPLCSSGASGAGQGAT
jgi:hypothetical protein